MLNKIMENDEQKNGGVYNPHLLDNPEDHTYHPHERDSYADAKIEKTKTGIFGFFIMRSRLTVLFLIGVIMLGSFALSSIPRESDPEVKIPIAVITTFFPGASPADVESLVTDEIESKIEELEDVKLVTSNSVLSLSSIVVEFEAEADLEGSIRKLKDKVAEVRKLPDDAENPMVTQVRANDFPIITFSIAGDLSEDELKELGENVQDELEKISGISEVTLIGVRNREFSIEVNRGALDRLGIPLANVVGSIAAANNDTPLGSITIDKTNYNLRTVAKLKSLEDVKKIIITTAPGQGVFLEDIAIIKDHLAEQNNMARLSVDGQPAVNTISLSILKKTGGNILDIVDEAKQTLADLQEKNIIPKTATVEISSDFSQFIKKDLETLGGSGVFSVFLIFLILFLALSLREALISLVAIPISFLMTFFIIDFRGDTLNSLVLFSLVLSLGLLVDAFIIILEGIFANLRLGYNSKEAALLSVAEYKTPLISGTLTTISAFVPMLLVSGILGEYLKVLPITLSTVLLSSLFVSLVIVPSMAAVILKRKKISLEEQKKKESLLEKYLTKRLAEKYSQFVYDFLASRKKKIKFVSATVITFVVSLGIIISPIVPVKLFPEVDIDFTYINLEMPVGANLESTNEVITQIENYLYTRQDIKTFTTSVGSAASFGFGGSGASGENVGNVNVTFVDAKDRELKSYEINKQLRQDLKFINQGIITIEEISSGPPTGAPIEARITGSDIAIVDGLATQLVEILKTIDGVIEIDSDQEVSPADLTFTIKREALAQAGLSIGEVSGHLRTAIFGLEATQINIDGDDVNVIVRLNENHIDSIEQLNNLSIINNQGQSVKLSRVADFSLEPALAAIRHRNFERTATVRANLEQGFVPTVVVPQIETALKNITIPDGYKFNFGGEVEDIEQSFSELWTAMIVAVLLILVILVLQFNSFKQPIIIMLTLPLSLIGVVVGMLIFRLPFSFSVFLGLISLAGIIVNDAIVLLDKTNRNVKELKMKPRAAVTDAGASRLQPILLTSITTMAGILPLTWADEFWLGLSIAIIFGIGFATILQLFIVPILYLQLEGKNVLKNLNQK